MNGNSGIQYRSKRMTDAGPYVVGGYQADFEANETYSGILYEERGRGILAPRGKKTRIVEETVDGKAKHKVEEVGSVGESSELQKLIKKEDWNSYEVTAEGNHLIHKINGQVFSEVTDEQPSRAAKAGILALQLHAGPAMTVQFKNIRHKRLKLTAGQKKVVMIAGRPSHGKGDHEHNAGTMLLKNCLDSFPGLLVARYRGEKGDPKNGWPNDPTAFDNADVVLFYADGGGGHPAIQDDHLHKLNALMKQGVGMVCLHYGVEVPKDRGGPEFLDWIGGYFEAHWSVNPHWTANFSSLPQHPITRGVKPFEINDEWYYHMRFREGMEGVTPILTAIPPKETLSRPDGPHSGNPDVRKTIGQPQHVAWAAERDGGGRGFGFTGGHFHRNWADPNFRKTVLNAIVWAAHLEVPENGVECEVTKEQMTANLDPK